MVVGGVLLLLLWARGRGEARRDTDDGDAAAGYTQQYYLIIFVIRNKLQLHAGICVPGMYVVAPCTFHGANQYSII